MTISEIEENKENLNFIKNRIIPIESIFKDKSKILLNKRKLELFLNGVKLKIDENDGVYRIYSNNKFIGVGEVKQGLLKRDVIL